ncbi:MULTISPECIES: antiviral reverse transcriptase Drt4 [unclassified Caballeronia]|uniref:antiviral reverse transcriptase Drt4 n=1 Tax=unclassified Caballeronia TaxID=2646786 RepID=UPI0028644D86|nr:MULTISPECIES: antiviral reverse transcriptase Drt4 [unclassified Caballeronia]MDR5751288.1 RNA-directed DNA polymerase [Caballeronia sp. LZ024]MDR5844574.1 RNA-directed DNA polymerase [Caballeronia sp. LZ031]
MIFDNNRWVYEGLSRFNFFPNQKAPIGELPPCITSRQLTPEVAELVLAAEGPKARDTTVGYDEVSYLMTRHDNIPRRLSLIHPVPYLRMASHIWTHWNEISSAVGSENSAIKPERHDDPRILIMNYEDVLSKSRHILSASFGKRFKVETDIASCFNSIYSHSIPWAVVGVAAEKARMRGEGQTHWSDRLDAMQRTAKRKETVGVAIGPGTSSVIVEIILGQVDERLREKGYEFRRFIDDYICFAETHDKAQAFLSDVGRFLSDYRLHLNLQKTSIVELPEPLSASWVTELSNALESLTFVVDEKEGAKIYSNGATQYLDLAIKLNRETRDGSILKYAFGSLIAWIHESALYDVSEYLVNLAWHYPALLPYLDSLHEKFPTSLDSYEPQLNAIIIENAKHRRSDGMAWPLHLMRKAGLKLTNEAIESIMASRDCVAYTLLFEMHQADDRIIDFAKDLLGQDALERDQYWLLLYQLAYHKAISSHESEKGFAVMLEHMVNFVPSNDKTTIAEEYCNYLNNPFWEEGEKPLSLGDWVLKQGNPERDLQDDPFGQ